MAMITTIETRLAMELERKYLMTGGDLPEAVKNDIADFPALQCKVGFGVTRASDLVARLQPWTERQAVENDRITKVAGVRYTLVIGIVDEPWVRALVDDGSGRLRPWRDRDHGCLNDDVGQPFLTIVGTEEDLAKLSSPTTEAAIEELLRSQTACHRKIDWMLDDIFGIRIPELAKWISDVRSRNEAAGLALIRRNTRLARIELSDKRRRIDAATATMLRKLRNFYEIARLVEIVRARVASRVGINELLGILASLDETVLTLDSGAVGAEAITDGWMTIGALHAARCHGTTYLRDEYPLVHYSGDSVGAGTADMTVAMRHETTQTFHADAMRSPDVMQHLSRTMVPVENDDPLDFFCGIEVMRLLPIGLRMIARSSGAKGALSNANRMLLGRLALWFLGEIAPDHYDAYVTRWANTRTIKKLGLTRADLDNYLTDPSCPDELGGGFVINSERARQMISVDAASAFNPWFWNRAIEERFWSACYSTASSDQAPAANAGILQRKLLLAIAKQKASLPDRSRTSPEIVAEAVALTAEIGAHGTPCAFDPALMTASMSLARSKTIKGAASSATPRPTPNRVKRIPGKVRRLGKR
ncbi:MAG: hypothetical protein OSB00_10920 [Sphingomonas bacterium]|nr:hypothetical protein [Sphingomonas bacterium]